MKSLYQMGYVGRYKFYYTYYGWDGFSGIPIKEMKYDSSVYC